MATLAHRLEYLAARAGSIIAQRLPARIADKFGAGLGLVAYYLMPGRRRVAGENLCSIFAPDGKYNSSSNLVRSVFMNLGRTTVELARMSRIKGSKLLDIIEDNDAHQAIAEALKGGKGAIVALAHFGNWEYGGAWVAARGFPVHYMVARQKNQYIDKMVNQIRADTGGNIVYSHGSGRKVLTALKDNQVVVIVADQHSPQGGITLPFLGRPAQVARGPAYFAVRAHCPIVPLMLLRQRYDKFSLLLGQPEYPNDTRNEENEIRDLTQRFNHFFEETIRKHPEQWMWTHRRWKIDYITE